ncbi:MAG: tRNA (N(6)-L-threonylcarbamoyladenosine(37)-C(2))-methylthiotransferase MtaB [Oligoflexales bacterium]
MPSVYVKTLGCKVNSFDSHAIENQFQALGWELRDSAEAADVFIVNSCSVTENAEKEARYWIRRNQREHPDSLKVITGCYAQIDSKTIADLEYVDVVIPNEIKASAAELISKRWNNQWTGKVPEHVALVEKNKQGHFKSAPLFASSKSSRTRVFLKVQDGCNGFCSYCQIPYARGQSCSVPIADILEEAEKRFQDGCREIVLTGIHLGDYGRDLSPETHFPSLFREILNLAKNHNSRIRLSSLEPSEVTPDLIAVALEYQDQFCDSFHLPLQSGSDKILKKMRRQYTKARYLDSVHQIRNAFPHARITADIIPGFPGETDDDFKETMDFIEHECSLASLHVFPYSKRPNTAALRLPDHLDPKVTHKRAESLRKLSHKLNLNYGRFALSKSHQVLWETSKGDRGQGRTSNDLAVVCPTPMTAGSFSQVSLKGFTENGKLLGIPLH